MRGTEQERHTAMSGKKQRWTVSMGGPLMRVPEPLGYTDTGSFGNGSAEARSSRPATAAPDPAMERVRMRKLWEAARSPLSGVLMAAFMMYMVGNSIQIFPLFMIGMACMNAFKNFFAVTKGLCSPHFSSSAASLVVC